MAATSPPLREVESYKKIGQTKREKQLAAASPEKLEKGKKKKRKCVKSGESNQPVASVKNTNAFTL